MIFNIYIKHIIIYKIYNTIISMSNTNNVKNINNTNIINNEFNNEMSTRLKSFPKCCNLQFCREKIKENQQILIEEVRGLFWKEIKYAVDNSMIKVSLKFPENLLKEYRIIITNELIFLFGSINIIGQGYEDNNIEIFGVTNENDIPDIPKEIIINFFI